MTEHVVNHEANPLLRRMLDALGMQVNVGVRRGVAPGDSATSNAW